MIPPQRAGRIAEIAGAADATGWCPIDPVTFESKLVPEHPCHRRRLPRRRHSQIGVGRERTGQGLRRRHRRTCSQASTPTDAPADRRLLQHRSRPATASRSPATTSPTATSLPRSRAARPARSMPRASSAPARRPRRNAGLKPSRRIALARAMPNRHGDRQPAFAPAAQVRTASCPTPSSATPSRNRSPARPGDAARGRALVLARHARPASCCHSGPFSDDALPGRSRARSHGTREPLDGEASCGCDMVDARAFQSRRRSCRPIYRIDGLIRVGTAVARGKPILTAAEIEDVVAYLVDA